MSIKEKLLQIQSELKAPKGQYNAFGGYKYRNAEDILEAVKPLLKKTKCIVIASDEIVHIGDRYYVKATVSLIDTESDMSMSTTAFAREEEAKKGMDGSQITGASSSYARKYALNGLFAIDDNKDSDTTNNHSEGKTNGFTDKINKAKTVQELTEIYSQIPESERSDYINLLSTRKKALSKIQQEKKH